MTTASSMITCAGCKHSYADTALFCPNCGRAKARDAAPVDPLVGKILGERFQINEFIGQGASGTIYRGEHVTLRRKVAVKVLHNELSRDDLAVERFRREATTVAEIDNEHIVEIHDFGRTHDGRLYLAMELLEGETLDQVLAREKTMSVERTADILIQVGEALMEAHAIGYVHRDLRPRNVYLAVRRGKANFVKLLDFGLAKLVETDAQAASTSLGMTFGDPRYMSPEQARGDRIDRRADIYQLGCVAYEMLTGQPPFVGNRVFDILSKQVTEVPAPLPTRRPGVPLWMEAAVAKMLAKDPDNRFATTTRMVEALRLGLETGQVMEDEIARRRESIPPPSVSRVMQKMGLPAPIDPAPVSNPPVVGKETLKGHLEGPSGTMTGVGANPVAQSAAPAPAGKGAMAATQVGHASELPPAAVAPTPAVEPERRRTGTPQVGVPILPTPGVLTGPPSMPAPLAPSPITPSSPLPAALANPKPAEPVKGNDVAPVTGMIEPRVKSPTGPVDAVPSGRAKRPSSQGALTDSSVWFEDGERASEEIDRNRRKKSPSTSGISPSSTDLSLYDEPAQTRRWPLVLGGLLLLGLVGGAVALGMSHSDKKAKAAQTDTTPPTPVLAGSDVPPSQVIDTQTPPTQVAAKPIDTKVDPKTDVKHTTSTKTSGTPKSTKTTKTSPTTTNTNDDAASRRPTGGGWFDSGDTTNNNTTTTPTNTTITNPTTTTPTNNGTGGVSGGGGPQDPYGAGADDPPPEGVSADKKAEFFANVGSQQLASGDLTGAAASYKKALEIDAKNVVSVIGMGDIALRQGLWGDAVTHLKKAARLAPKSSRVFTLLGEAYLNSGNNTLAAENFKKALQLDPENTRARDGYNEASAKVPPPEDE
jgi:serine/threonine-protein kinase